MPFMLLQNIVPEKKIVDFLYMFLMCSPVVGMSYLCCPGLFKALEKEQQEITYISLPSETIK